MNCCYFKIIAYEFNMNFINYVSCYFNYVGNKLWCKVFNFNVENRDIIQYFDEHNVLKYHFYTI